MVKQNNTGGNTQADVGKPWKSRRDAGGASRTLAEGTLKYVIVRRIWPYKRSSEEQSTWLHQCPFSLLLMKDS